MAEASVIIPLYNKGILVKRAVDSILAQTFQDFEIVVVDDGSTDDGPTIIAAYEDPRIRLIRQSNSGPGAARNRGVKEAASDLIAFLDADDEFLPEFLEKSISNLKNNPDCVLSVVNHYRGKDKIPATDIPPWNVGIEKGPWRLPPDIDTLILWGSFLYLQTWAVMCRRDVIIKYGGFYERRCTYAEDQYLWLQIILNCKIYRDTEPLFWYHTEDSELLGPNRKINYTIFPYLAEPGPIRGNCPTGLRDCLERLFGITAASDYSNMAAQCDLEVMKYLLEAFPSMKKWVRDWRRVLFKVRIKLAMPWMVPPVRAVKRILG